MIRAIIVDDEPRAIELLEDYVLRCGRIELIASFRDPLKALAQIDTENVDLLFLDIDMPGLSGISLAGLLKKEIQIIFTTAYSDYAVKSYDLNAIDYLLKPISFERFLKAVQKVSSQNNNTISEKGRSIENEIISIKSGYEIYRVAIPDILYLEKEGNYMTYHLKEGKIVARQNIQEAMSKLPDSFIQIHKSYIVPIDRIKVIDKTGLQIGNVLLPIGNTYRSALMKRIT